MESLRPSNPQRDGSLFRELDGVAQQVDKNLPDFIAVGSHSGQTLFQIEGEVNRGLVLGESFGQITNFPRERFDLEVRDAQIDLPRLGLGDVQNSVDELKQVFAAVFYLFEAVLLVFVQRMHIGAFEQTLGESDDGAQGGAKLMAHVGQKIGLGLIGAFGQGLRFLQGHVGRLQCSGVLFQLFFRLQQNLFPLACDW